LDLAFWIVAHETVFPPLELVGHFWCQTHEGGCGFGPSLRRMAGIALARQVVLRRPVAVAADILGHPLALGMANVARRALVRPN